MSNPARPCIVIAAALLVTAMSACMTPADSPQVDETSTVRDDMPLVADNTVDSTTHVTEMELEEGDAATSIGQWMRESEIIASVVARLNGIFAWQDVLEIGHGRCGMEYANFLYVRRETGRRRLSYVTNSWRISRASRITSSSPIAPMSLPQ